MKSLSSGIHTSRYLNALKEYDGRGQFHDHTKLGELIEAAREEERAKFPALMDATRAIVDPKPLITPQPFGQFDPFRNSK